MKKIIILALHSIALMMLYGCESSDQVGQKYGQPLSSTEFLSDYSKLESISSKSYRYVNPNNTVGNYGRYIIGPVKVIFDAKTKAEIGNWDDRKAHTYSRQTIITMVQYLEAAGISPRNLTAPFSRALYWPVAQLH